MVASMLVQQIVTGIVAGLVIGATVSIALWKRLSSLNGYAKDIAKIEEHDKWERDRARTA